MICLATASYHPPGATQEDAGSCRFSSGFTRGLPSPRAFPGLLRILQTETPVRGKAEKENVQGRGECSVLPPAQRNLLTARVPQEPSEAMEINGGKVFKNKGKNLFMAHI